MALVMFPTVESGFLSHILCNRPIFLTGGPGFLSSILMVSHYSTNQQVLVTRHEMLPKQRRQKKRLQADKLHISNKQNKIPLQILNDRRK